MLLLDFREYKECHYPIALKGVPGKSSFLNDVFAKGLASVYPQHGKNNYNYDTNVYNRQEAEGRQNVPKTKHRGHES